MQTAVIYARYSSYGQTEQSIEGQVRECTDYARLNNILIVDSYIDRAMTGTNDNRTDFQRMLKDSAKKAWDLILVYKLDRFSRNKYEMAIHRKTLRDNGVRLISVKENIPDTPEGIILESLLEGMAEYYSVELAQKVKRGQKETRIKGNYCGGGIPYGYKVEKIGDCKKYVICEEEAKIVVRIYEEYAAGKIGRKIIEDLTADGIMARNGKPMGRNMIYGILQNERYTGIYRHKTDGVFTETFPRIVPQHLFDTVQEINKENETGRYPQVEYLLRNKMKCGYCGYPMSAEAGTARSGEVMRYYKCSGRKQMINKCPKQTLRKGDLENLVIETTIRVLDNPENIDLLVEKIFEANATRVLQNATLPILEKEKVACQKAIDNLMKAVEQGITSKTTQKRLIELEEKLEDLDVKISIEESKGRIQISRQEIKKFINKALQKEPRQMLRMLIKGIILYDDKIEIYYNHTERKRPDEETHQAFCLYTEEIIYDMKAWWTKLNEEKVRIKVDLYF